MFKKLLIIFGLAAITSCVPTVSYLTPKTYTYHATREHVWQQLIGLYIDQNIPIAEQHHSDWMVRTNEIRGAANETDAVQCASSLPNVQVTMYLVAFLSTKQDSTVLHLILNAKGQSPNGLEAVACQSVGSTEAMIAAGVYERLFPTDDE